MSFVDWFKKDENIKPCLKCGFGMSELVDGSWKCSKCGYEKKDEVEE